jgi:hypothetical protein
MAVADAGADYDAVKGRQVDLRAIVDRNQRDRMTLLFDHLPQAVADPEGVAICSGVEEQDAGHGFISGFH